MDDNIARISYEGKEILLVATAHVSQESVELVKRVIEEERPDSVCIELDEGRYNNIQNPKAWMDLPKSPAPTTNFHTHTFRCKHAEGDVMDYVKAASEVGITHLGFADHTPLTDRWMHMIRMEVEDLPGYVAALREAVDNPYGVMVYGGMECDYKPEYEAYFRDELLGNCRLDYLVGSVHAFPWQGDYTWIHPGVDLDAAQLKAYAEHVAKAIASGLFAFIAHPDLFNQGLRKWNPEVRACIRDILAAAEAYQVPLEINPSGYAKARQSPEVYLPCTHLLDQFWEEAAGFNVTVLVNSDAHKPSALTTDLQAGYKTMHKYGLKEATLPFVRQ
ncbi:PHP domain-containing protein [Ruminococcaceae bacterium OttesenSCG-928-L11]|nr:PHP domain-containing protein [Ruminococcaceae bacterium OttesenSCG-928-L11]